MFFQFNYQCQLHSAIYHLISKISSEYSKVLYDNVYQIWGKYFKISTFSKLNFVPFEISENGFKGVRKIEFIFSTVVDRSVEHLVLDIFSVQEIIFNFYGVEYRLFISEVNSLPEPEFGNEEYFLSLSPIAVSTGGEDDSGKLQTHFFDYMKPGEREDYITHIRDNLIREYELIYDKEFQGKLDFEFSFDTEYIIRQKEETTKLVHFKPIQGTHGRTKIKGFEVPFTIKKDTALIRLGYQCGFSEKNSCGFGCMEELRL